MSYALAELEAVSLKATRGVGLSWGMAEETGKAARWLCSVGLDGCAATVAALSAIEAGLSSKLSPLSFTGQWGSETGMLCPINAGVALCDGAYLWKDHGVVMKNILAPVMLLGFIAQSAMAFNETVTIRWSGIEAVTDGKALSLISNERASLLDKVSKLDVNMGGRMKKTLPLNNRVYPREADWAALLGYSERIYAPISESSRLNGAGAGVIDKD